MFNNIGGKIKTLAKVICWIGIICSCIVGLNMMSRSTYLDWAGEQHTDASYLIYGLLIAAAGSFVSWLSTLTLYGFGQLIENSDKLVIQGESRAYELSEENAETNSETATSQNDSGDVPAADV